MYKVLRDFVDLADDNHLYHKGDDYPRAGVEVGKERLAELSTSANKCHVPLIEAIDEPEEEEAAKESKPKKAKKKE